VLVFSSNDSTKRKVRYGSGSCLPSTRWTADVTKSSVGASSKKRVVRCLLTITNPQLSSSSVGLGLYTSVTAPLKIKVNLPPCLTNHYTMKTSSSYLSKKPWARIRGVPV
jgi:hypothetical protein